MLFAYGEYPSKIWPYIVNYLHFRIQVRSPIDKGHQLLCRNKPWVTAGSIWDDRHFDRIAIDLSDGFLKEVRSKIWSAGNVEIKHMKYGHHVVI